MLQHAGIEIAPAEVDRAVLLFELLGFERVEPPPSLAGGFTWVEREGTQIHLMHDEHPVVPPRGHVAVHVPDYEAARERLREHGFESEPGREHWGAPRSKVTLPGGQQVELMSAPPT
jgi:glyoxalase/bleomycin resistance protein/dioxygenase superfamily protein